MSRFRKPLTVKRISGGAYDVSGFWVEGTESEITIQASVQPASYKEMELVDENRRETSKFKIYTDTLLRTAEKGSQNPDRVVYNSEEYEVVALGDWHNDVINHYKYLMSKVVSND